MITGPDKTTILILLTLLPVQTACVSYQHRPDPATLVKSANCEAVYGSYVVDSTEDGRTLAQSLFDEEEPVSGLTVEKTANQIAVHANTVNGQLLSTKSLNRFSCTGSVLKLILRDQYSANGVYMEASDLVVELFVPDENSLNLRLVNTTLAFFFIIPYYSSSDALITLRRQSADLD